MNSGRRVRSEEQRIPELNSAIDQIAASTLVQVMSSVNLRNLILATDSAQVLKQNQYKPGQRCVSSFSTYKKPRQKMPSREYFCPLARFSLPITGNGSIKTIKSVKMFRAAFENHWVWLSMHLPGLLTGSQNAAICLSVSHTASLRR